MQTEGRVKGREGRDEEEWRGKGSGREREWKGMKRVDRIRYDTRIQHHTIPYSTTMA